MNFKKAITMTACAAMIGTSFSLVSSLNENGAMNAHAYSMKLSNKQFNSDMNAATKAASHLGSTYNFDNSNVEAMKNSGMLAYTNYYNSFPALLNSAYGNASLSGLNAVKDLYHHFYNRFDTKTKMELSSYYHAATPNNFSDLASSLSNDIKNWAANYDGVAAPVKNNNNKTSNHKTTNNKKHSHKNSHAKKHHSKKDKK
ncbi:hypothetical protein MOO46_05690 [Apilactobacillus apisilvae]|uniref:Uncharacterized protein n=1 Tax=Apilactobacillus apisilvae TaxID=2923364 RepID=A0ABY4PG20_9LACO|nr:hypothetical protein [Apilactobacillus apisilvae]UQS84739.1 hypothetical protein MOO46_05690 [Apilactobacillus apisilvae]